ncbi:MAG: hypothetical protein JNL73_20160 [Anaerolineales bacterium]|nr:hypothetical protein [Anaerolineales bacterium]
MKLKSWLASAILTAAVLSACAAPAPAAPVESAAAYVSANLDTSYENALSARNQLALGTLNLAGTPAAVSPEQAAALLPLWQAVRATSQSGGGSQTEVNALLTQIEAGLTEAQLTAIRAQGLTQTDLQDWATANGVTLGTGGGEPGSGQGLSPEARATRQAEQGRTPNSTGGGASTALVEAVATYLESLGS